MEQSLELLRNVGANRYVLEVLQSNAAAIRVYQRLGFEITRELFCWTLDRPARRSNQTRISTVAAIDVREEELWDWTPSWQNSHDSIRRAGEPRTFLAAGNEDDVVGYATVFKSGDLPQLAVAKDRRREGIGTALIDAAREASEHPLRIINTDGGDPGTAVFLRTLGAQETVRQYEMILSIDRA
jgi:ribosomal protein S18 acetylase RimI-like enzyme